MKLFPRPPTMGGFSIKRFLCCFNRNKDSIRRTSALGILPNNQEEAEEGIREVEGTDHQNEGQHSGLATIEMSFQNALGSKY